MKKYLPLIVFLLCAVVCFNEVLAQAEHGIKQDESTQTSSEGVKTKQATQKRVPKKKIVKKSFYPIVLKNHEFHPVSTVIPAGVEVRLVVHNQDATAEEFESHDLNREIIIEGRKKAVIYIGPLLPGRYHFYGEFHRYSASAYIIAK